MNQKCKLIDNQLKVIHINDCSNYNLNNINNVKDLVLENTKVDKKSFKYIITYHVGYGTLHGIKTLYFTFHKTIGFIENNDEYKYLILTYIDKEHKDMIEKYREIVMKLNILLSRKMMMYIMLLVTL